MNQFYVMNYTTGGTTPPKYVFIDTPSQGTTITVPIAITVVGHIESGDEGYKPSYLSCWSSGGGSYWYNPDPLDPATWTFSFTANVSASTSYIDCYSDGTNSSGGYAWHEHQIYINPTQDYHTEYIRKPGAETPDPEGAIGAKLIMERVTGSKVPGLERALRDILGQ